MWALVVLVIALITLNLNGGVEVYRGPVYVRVGGKSFIECEECDCCDCLGEDCPFNDGEEGYE